MTVSQRAGLLLPPPPPTRTTRAKEAAVAYLKARLASPAEGAAS